MVNFIEQDTSVNAVTGGYVDLLGDTKRRKSASPTAVKIFLRLTEAWGLNNNEKRSLLGGISKATYHLSLIHISEPTRPY